MCCHPKKRLKNTDLNLWSHSICCVKVLEEFRWENSCRKKVMMMLCSMRRKVNPIFLLHHCIEKLNCWHFVRQKKSCEKNCNLQQKVDLTWKLVFYYEWFGRFEESSSIHSAVFFYPLNWPFYWNCELKYEWFGNKAKIT